MGQVNEVITVSGALMEERERYLPSQCKDKRCVFVFHKKNNNEKIEEFTLKKQSKASDVLLL